MSKKNEYLAVLRPIEAVYQAARQPLFKAYWADYERTWLIGDVPQDAGVMRQGYQGETRTTLVSP